MPILWFEINKVRGLLECIFRNEPFIYLPVKIQKKKSIIKLRVYTNLFSYSEKLLDFDKESSFEPFTVLL